MKIKLFGITIGEVVESKRDVDRPNKPDYMGDDAYDILKGSCSDLTCYHQIPPCSGCRRMFGKEDNE